MMNVEMLATVFKFAEDIPASHAFNLVRAAVLHLLKTNDLSINNLLRNITKREQDYLRKPIENFTVLTSISIKSRVAPNPRVFPDARITFNSHRPKSFDTGSAYRTASEDGVPDSPSDYSWVRATVSARSHWEAHQKGIDAIDLLRGIWNFVINFKSFSVVRIGKPRPVNRVVKGPIHTIHKPHGQLSDFGYWYDQTANPLYLPEALDFDRQTRLIELERLTRKRLSKLAFRVSVERYILDYTRALDTIDQHAAFLDLWRLLEKLTGTKRQSYDVTVKRASRMFKDQEYYRTVLNLLRDIRNESVHAGTQLENENFHLTELKLVVETLLRFHIFNPFGFASLDEAYTYLDLPNDPNLLRKQIRYRQYALHSLGEIKLKRF